MKDNSTLLKNGNKLSLESVIELEKHHFINPSEISALCQDY